MVERDPIDDLRGLWSRLDAPELDHSDAEGDARDERADAAVSWMRDSWSRLEAPAPELPWVLRRRRVVRTAAWFAAAAALLAAVTVVLANLPHGSVGERDREDRIANRTEERVEDRADDATTVDDLLSDPRVVRVLGAGDTNDVRTEVDREGRVVMRRGSVDLVWVTPNESPF